MSEQYLPSIDEDDLSNFGAKTTHIATRSEQRCNVCSRKIPIGARYFKEKAADYEWVMEHTNCLDFEREPIIPMWHPRKNGRYVEQGE